MPGRRRDKIEFILRDGHIRILINSRDLLEHVRDAERSAGFDDEAFLGSHLLELGQNRLFTLDPDNHPPNRTTWLLLYVCACGFPCCGAVWVRARHTPSTVRWTEFVGPGQVARNYGQIEKFCFSRDQYDAAMYEACDKRSSEGTRQKGLPQTVGHGTPKS